MNHALPILFAFVMCGCEVVPLGTTAKLKALQRTAHRGHALHHTAHRQAAAEGAAYVTPAWLNEYHSLEAEHGGYVIPDDSRIQVGNDGKIKVPHTVVKHFNDLSRAPVRPAEPQPNE